MKIKINYKEVPGRDSDWESECLGYEIAGSFIVLKCPKIAPEWEELILPIGDVEEIIIYK
jgi:hypothetical protein